MPMYDRKCPDCGALLVDCYERRDTPDPSCDCGGRLSRVWLPNTRVGAIDDSWPNGQYFEHVSHTGETFYSRSELKRYLRATGQMEYVRHQPKPGSDKSPHTSRWI